MFGVISVFDASPRFQCLIAQMCLMTQFVVHANLRPYISSSLDQTDGLLTLALELFTLFGMVFCAQGADGLIEGESRVLPGFRSLLTLSSIAVFTTVSAVAITYMAREVQSIGEAVVFTKAVKRNMPAWVPTPGSVHRGATLIPCVQRQATGHLRTQAGKYFDADKAGIDLLQIASRCTCC